MTNNIDEVIKEVRIQLLRYIGFKKKADPEAEQVLYFTTHSDERKYFSHRYSLSVPKSLERSKVAFVSMNSSGLLQQIIKEINFQDTFEELIGRYISTGLVKIVNNTYEIHVSVIKRHWLDCAVSFQVFFTMLQAPLHGKEWVTFNDYLRSIEAAHQKNIVNAFLSSKHKKKLGVMMRIQKLLCIFYIVFFCIVEYEVKQMDAGGLIKVMQLGHRMQKTMDKEIIELANEFMTRANKIRKEDRVIITFQEFKNLLLNSVF
ncbi:hypothetical protein SteCoe_34305 [Stentor coeruleus]|uniref:Uncharacterized protein n=1 Tax=Stentor coeruleus TaxID=5963 RepID=A0A1R2AUU6_9CILI|nr:hypothetical protein SteCoe_34305 [Stentor coeruleus]